MITIHSSHVFLHGLRYQSEMKGCTIDQIESSLGIDVFAGRGRSLLHLRLRQILGCVVLELPTTLQRCRSRCCCYRHRQRRAIRWPEKQSFLRLVGMPSKIPPCRRIPKVRSETAFVSGEQIAECQCCLPRPHWGNQLRLVFWWAVPCHRSQCSSELLLPSHC